MARLSIFLAALWWGSLTAVGALVVPMLFQHLPTPALAGQLAGKLFGAQTWVSLSCGLLLLLISRRENKDAAETPSIWVIAGILLALMVEVGVKPHILARDHLALWHSLGSALYAIQWTCAAKVLWDAGPAQATVADAARDD